MARTSLGWRQHRKPQPLRPHRKESLQKAGEIVCHRRFQHISTKIPACHSELYAAHVAAGEKQEGAEASKDEDTGEAADAADGTDNADAADADDPEESLPTKDTVSGTFRTQKTC